MKTIKKSIAKSFYKTACNFCEWLQTRLYDEKTWQELDNENYKLRTQLDDLENEIEYLQFSKGW